MSSTIKKKLNTLKSSPHAVFTKYVVHGIKYLFYPLAGMPKPYLDENYDTHWNFASFEEKTILDLGADYGSTAAWFHKKGAKKVIAIEADKQLYSKLSGYSKGKEWLCSINEFVDSSEKIDDYISNYAPDIVKVDIEGFEKNLVNCTKLQEVPTWLIEVHSNEIDGLLTAHFTEKGYSVQNVPYLEVGLLLAKRIAS
jgi:hypothetical protein